MTLHQRFVTLIVTCVMLLGAHAQQPLGYEYQGELPVYIDSIHARLTYPMAYRNYIKLLSTTDTLKGLKLSQMAWRAAARIKMIECMGERPPLPSSWDMKVVAEEKRDGYSAQLIEFSLSRWYRVRAYLLIPDNARKGGGQTGQSRRGAFPSVVLMHDHGAHLSIGKEKVVRPFNVGQEVMDDANSWVDQLYEGQYLGDYLASNGFVVLAIDMPLWGERGRAEGVDRKKYDIIAGNMMMAGANICAYTHYDDLASIDFLSSLPFVDSERIGVAGLSIGAYRSWMAAALSDKVKVTCAVCWMVTTDAQLTMKYGRKENGGFANAIPGLRNWLDYPDIASLAAPNHMMIIAGRQDKLFPLPGVEKAFGIMHDVWDAYGAPDNISTYILDQKHECNKINQTMILNYLKQHL